MVSRGMRLLFVLLALATASQYVLSQDQRFDRSQRSRPSVLSLFNIREKSKYWSDKIMWGGFDDLEASAVSDFSKEAQENYTSAGTIANYLKLAHIDAVYLPVPINFIFIGFDGHGNHEIKLGEEELQRWFMNIDHILEHTRIPQRWEITTPFDQIKSEKQRSFPSYTHYNYSVHAIELDENVCAVFEQAIKIFSRKEDIADTRAGNEVFWQVDMNDMAYLFSSLVHYLELDNAYNVFVLNPKRNERRGPYGYRYGLSDSEISLIKKDVEMKLKLRTTKRSGSRHPLDIESIKKPLYRRHPMLKFSWTPSYKADTAQWVTTFRNTLSVIEHMSHGKSDNEIVFSKALEILQNRNLNVASVLLKEVHLDPNSGLESECLVDTWVGKERWAFIDLTAGPFSWGPAVGGEGVRTNASLPSVDKSFGDLTVKGEADVGGDDGLDELQNFVQDRFAVFEEEERHAIDMLLAEVDVYELFAERHCRGRKIKIALCQELQERMDDIRDELETFKGEEHDERHQTKATDALKRIDKWNLFGDIHEHVQNFSVARDSFLAHLGATLSASMRHIVTPSTADGSFVYFERVTIQLYIVTPEIIKHTDLLPVDISEIKEALSSLAVSPSQKFQYSVHMLPLSEDPALSMAFSVAQRAAVVPTLLVNGTYKLSTRVYIDSLILQHQLQQLTSRKPQGNDLPDATGKSIIEVPVFWFIRMGEPVFIDKHYLAKALSDMVIVIQSSNTSWESHLQCNGKSILWNLRRPHKAAVAAVAAHLAGLMPSHLAYSEAREEDIQDWVWSVGYHPFSSTSGGWQISTFQSDAIARSYIVTAVDQSIELVNEAIDLLLKEATYRETFRAFKLHDKSLLREYNNVVSLWRRIAGVTEDMRFGEAVKQLPSLSHASEKFMKTVKETVGILHPIHCTRQHKIETRLDVLIGIVMLMAASILYCIFKPKRTKPKIN